MKVKIFVGKWRVVMEGELMVRFDRNDSQAPVEWGCDSEAGWKSTPWKTENVHQLCDDGIFDKVCAWLDWGTEPGID